MNRASKLLDETGRRYQRHGRAYDPAIRSWQRMISRCQSPNDYNYPNWGGRGIKVCDEWQDAKVFCEWAHANGYGPGLTIERKDVNGNYCPENCCWITRGEQGKNQRTTRRVTVNGKTMCLSDAARLSGLTRQAVAYRLNKGWDIDRALFEPAHC